MSTRATDALVHTSQGEVARSQPTHGTQQAGHGKIGSAGFAQILGEQVAKSAPKVEAADTASRQLSPQTVQPSSPHATTQSLSQSLPHAAPQSLPQAVSTLSPDATTQSSQQPLQDPTHLPPPAVSEKAATHLLAQLRSQPSEQAPPTGEPAQPELRQPIENGKYPAAGLAQPFATETKGQEIPAKPSARLPGPMGHAEVPATTSRRHSAPNLSVARNAHPSTDTNKAVLSPVGPAKSSTETAHPEQDAATPSAQAGDVIGISREKTDNSAKQTMAPTAEVASATTAQPSITHEWFQPTQGLGALPRSGRALNTREMPLPSRKTTDPSVADNAGPPKAQKASPSAQVAASDQAPARPVSPASSPPARTPKGIGSGHALPDKGPDLTRPTTTHHSWPKSASSRSPSIKADRTPVPGNESETAAQVPLKASHVTPRQSTKANETVSTEPSKAGEAATFDSAHPLAATIPPMDTAPAPKSESSTRGTVQSSEELPSQVAVASSEVTPFTPKPILDAAVHEADLDVSPAVAPRTATPDVHPRVPTVRPTERLAPAEAESASVRRPSHVDQYVGAHPSTEHEPTPQSPPASTPVLPVAAAVSLPALNSKPASLPQDPPGSQPSQTPRSAEAPLASRPFTTPQTAMNGATAGAGTEPAIVPADRATLLTEAKQADLRSDTTTARANEGQPSKSPENAFSPAADKLAPISSQQAPVSTTPATTQVVTKNARPAESTAPKRRTLLTEDEQTADTATAPLPASQPATQPSPSSHSPTSENKPVRPEATQSAEHKSSAEPSSRDANAPSAQNQPHATKAELQAAVLPSAERPTVLVPQLGYVAANTETAVREAAIASPLAAERAELVDRAIDDPGLSLNVMPHSAHLSISGTAGDLALHVRVRDGSADVNVSGSMAPLFDNKAPEVRTVLASQGLHLGSFATDQQGNSQGQRQGQPESAPRGQDLQPPPTPRRTTTSIPEVQIADDKRIHVTA